MSLKKYIAVTAALFITIGMLLLLTSPLWIGWIMEYEHNKTRSVLEDYSLQCKEGSIEEREIWSKLGIAVFCEKDGTKHGPWQAWDGGYMHISGSYIGGQKHGTWKYFNARGEQWGERLFENGKEVTGLINLLTADYALLNKKDHKLYLKKNNKIYRSYNVRLDNEKILEGQYVLFSKNKRSKYYKAIHIKPQIELNGDKTTGANHNLKDNFMLHGQPNGLGWAWRLLNLFNWTNKNIAVKNQDMEELWSLVKDDTPIEVAP